jgi:hypothetical protein
MDDCRQSPSGRMSRGRSTRKTTRSGASSGGFWGALKPLKLKVASGIKQAFFVPKPSEWVTESSMPSTSGCPSSGGESSSLPCQKKLLNILESRPVPRKYLLSAKACSGGLQRAEKRGKKLPDFLEDALRSVVRRHRPNDGTHEPATSRPSTTTPEVAGSRSWPTLRPRTAARPGHQPNPLATRAIPTPNPSSPVRSSP